MSNPTELDVLKDVTNRLEAAEFEYMLTGSVAMNYYATPRMTRDIDLVVALDRDDAARIRELFAADYYVPKETLERTFAERGMFNLVHLESVAKVDIIVRKDEAYRKVEFGRRRRVKLDGFEVWIVSREDLILSKLIWAKPSRSEFQLRDVRNLMSRDADADYLRQWARELDVQDLLQECFDAGHQP
jgi:predicted nucleotidyltransferase